MVGSQGQPARGRQKQEAGGEEKRLRERKCVCGGGVARRGWARAGCMRCGARRRGKERTPTKARLVGNGAELVWRREGRLSWLR